MTCAFAAHVAQDKEKFLTLFSQDLEFKRSLSSLSRMGSGSSCRSFEGPFVHWESDQTLPICSELPPLVDLVLLISKEKKSVSSSLAHLKVKTSPLWSGRVDRVNVRISQMSEAMKLGNLPMISKIAWQEMFEMHSLFHTSEEPFTYWAPMSLDVLGYFKTFIEKGDNIIVTMDAGPNVHVLVPEKDQDLWLKRIVEKYPNLEILVDQQSKGIQFEI
jgi:diphosphomevalonate decarboxylase